MSLEIVSYDAYPPRAALKSQPVIAFGTSVAEGLESYLERLLSVHDIQRKHMECFITGDVDSEKRVRGCIEPVRPDSPWHTSRDFADRLAQLTGQPEVARLGLGWLTHVISGADALRTHVAWCALCVRDCHLGRRKQYVPLLWAVKSVEVCSVHNVVLATRCSNCEASFISRAGLRFPFLNCPRCLVPLHMGNGMEEPLAEPASGDQLAAAQQVGTMIAKLQERGDPSTLVKPSLRRIIDSAIRRELCVGTNDFVRQSQISKGTLSALLNGQKAGLDTWVRVSLAADVSLAGVFAPELWKEGVVGNSISWRSATSASRQRAPLQWAAIRDQATQLLQGASPISVYQLGRQLKADPQHIKRGLGSIASQLNKAAAESRAREAVAKAESLALDICVEADAMRSEGMRVSARSIAKRMNKGRRSCEFLLAFEKAAGRIRFSQNNAATDA
jgi:hypothetical protein